jgi:hypothetical protein
MNRKTGIIGKLIGRIKRLAARDAAAEKTVRRVGVATVDALRRDCEVLGIDDFTEADVEAIRRARPSPESAAFDHELTEDQQ